MSDSSDKKYLRQLLYAAEKYVDDSYSQYDKVKYFYRNKPEEYFREVKRNDNTLKKIKKDNNGDRRSPINGKLSGVFLGVTLWQGRLPSKSPFGSSRVCFPIAGLFKDTSNLYFTDFYCTVSENHYVTLVLTPSGSQEDVFCARSLIALDPENNMFFRRAEQYGGNTMSAKLGNFTTVRRFKLHVEVFYTENVHIDPLMVKFGSENVFYDTTGIIGKGTSTWGGLRKNTNCSICNPNAFTPEVTKSEAKRKLTKTPKPSTNVPSQEISLRFEPKPVAPQAMYTIDLGPSYNVGPSQPRNQPFSRGYSSSRSSYLPEPKPEPKPEPAQRSNYISSNIPEDESSCCGKKCCIIM